MSRFGHADILLELVDLCREISGEIEHQLGYYRASVYKQETSGIIKKKIEHLRLVANLIGCDHLAEIFHDHDAVIAAGALHYVPGECSFSARTTGLLKSMNDQLESLTKQHGAAHDNAAPTALARKVQQHRNQLLSLCRHGSRQWSFFQTV